MNIEIMDCAAGEARLDSLYTNEGDIVSPLPDFRHFAFQNPYGEWTAVYMCPPADEFFVEEFETKEQALLYLGRNDLSPEEIRSNKEN